MVSAAGWWALAAQKVMQSLLKSITIIPCGSLLEEMFVLQHTLRYLWGIFYCGEAFHCEQLNEWGSHHVLWHLSGAQIMGGWLCPWPLAGHGPTSSPGPPVTVGRAGCTDIKTEFWIS